jgi:hypothetical protein
VIVVVVQKGRHKYSKGQLWTGSARLAEYMGTMTVHRTTLYQQQMLLTNAGSKN